MGGDGSIKSPIYRLAVEDIRVRTGKKGFNRDRTKRTMVQFPSMVTMRHDPLMIVDTSREL